MDHLQKIIDQILAASPAVRYVALYRGGKLTSRQRSEIGLSYLTFLSPL
jgi:hypothetical protein